MKWNKNILLTLLAILLCGITTSCTSHEDELLLQSSGNGSFSTLGTVINTARLTINSDSYGPLLPVNTNIFTQNNACILGQRVLVEILFLNSKQKTDSLDLKEVEVISLYKVLTKDIDIIHTETTDNINDTFGTAPIQITSTTISQKHLNIQYEIEGYDENISHCISLLVPENAQPDVNGLLSVELRHNPENDLQINTFWGVVSFNLSSIPQYKNPKFKGFQIRYTKKDGSTTYTTVTL